MGEIERWFEREFGPLGFYLTPLMYNPNDFTPMRGVMYNNGNEDCNLCGRLTSIKITPELANDITLPFGTTPEDEYKDFLTREIERFLNEQTRTFTPRKFITKHKL